MRYINKWLLTGFLLGLLCAQQLSPAASRNPLELSQIKAEGILDRRINLGFQHIQSLREQVFSAEGHLQTWGGEHPGRWLDVMSQLARYRRAPIAEMDEVAKAFVAAQREDGSWGGLTWPSRWGALGLSEYWQLTKDENILRGIKRTGDYFLGVYKQAEAGAPPKSLFSQEGDIIGLLALWRTTGDDRFLKTAEWDALDSLKKGRMYKPDQHIHMCVLAGLRGMAELYLATGKKVYLEEAEKLHAHILKNQMWVTGGISELSQGHFETKDESCQVSDWLCSNLRLWQITGKPEYMDLAEHVLINHVFFDQDHTGGFCAYRSIGVGPATSLASRDFVAWFCCSFHGERALLEAAKYICTQGEDTIDVNLYLASRAEIALKGGNVKLHQNKDYSGDFDFLIEIEPDRTCEFVLRLRLPRWAISHRVELNGQPVDATPHNGYALIRRVWKKGDKVQVVFGADFRIVPDKVTGFSAEAAGFKISDDATKIERGAIMYGPFVLMVDPTLNPHENYYWESLEVLMPRDAQGKVYFPRPQKLVAGRGSYSVPGVCFMALGRGAKMPKSVEKNIIEPRNDEKIKKVNETRKPELGDDELKPVFLVPISEVTDSWTVTLYRMIPYEVRNNIWLVNKDQADQYQTRVTKELDRVVKEKWDETATYKMNLLHRQNN